jgi:hypothetical protein
VKTKGLAAERITVELTEFELTVLAALVERGQMLVRLEGRDLHDIRSAIDSVAGEFSSLLGHFELTSPMGEDANS